MPIFLDPTERDTDTRLPPIEGAATVAGLEAWSGADLIISPLDAPLTPVLLQQHSSAYALFVQRKSGHDLAHSVGPRLNSALCRMWEVAHSQPQRVLLITGTITEKDGDAWIDGRSTRMSYAALAGALARWNDRGGVVVHLASDSLIPQWAQMRERQLREYIAPGGEIKWCWPEMPKLTAPEPSDPMQMPVAVRDGRVTLATLPGIGQERAAELWQWGGGDLWRILHALTDYETLKQTNKPRGIGQGTIRSVRAYFHMEN
jgi:hypothetical protein